MAGRGDKTDVSAPRMGGPPRGESREEIAHRNPGGPSDQWADEAWFLARRLGGRGRGAEVGPGDRKVCLSAIGIGPDGAAADVAGYAEALSFPDGSLAYVVANHVLEHCADPMKVLREWRRAARPSGFIGFVAPDCDHQDTFSLNPEHRHITTQLICREWIRLVGGLEVLEQESPVPGWSIGFICSAV
jgi:SAM-dependent methyltransferase